MLKIKDVNQYYGGSHILRNVSAEAHLGKVTVVLGRNGVGKTTLLATIMGHTTFHAGRIRFEDTEVQQKAVYERCRLGIGYVPQERMIFPSLTVHENLDVARRPGRWTLDAVYGLFPRLQERKAAFGNQLSGGEQQMLAIGRALMGNPSLLLLDEPLEGLAPIIIEALLSALKKLVADESLAIILVEQHAKIALQVTQTALVLNRGRVAHFGPSAELLADPQRLTSLVMAQ
jgi:branched-chain amino acid transport system ATP-binding protein